MTNIKYLCFRRVLVGSVTTVVPARNGNGRMAARVTNTSTGKRYKKWSYIYFMILMDQVSFVVVQLCDEKYLGIFNKEEILVLLITSCTPVKVL